MSRRWLLILMSGLLILSLAACTGVNSEGSSDPTQTASSEEESPDAADDTDMDEDKSDDDADTEMDSEDSETDADSGADEDTAIDAAAIFSVRCSSCHGSEREGGGGPPLLPANLTKDPSAYAQTITNGSGRMPSWGDRLSVDEINALVEYILSEPQ